MKKMNRKLEYALMALQYLRSKKSGKLTQVRALCEELALPFDDTSRVMQVMCQHGVLKSEQGACGGYTLIKDLSRVSFLSLSEMIEGSTRLVKCFDSKDSCDFEAKCNIKGPLENFQSQLDEFYKSLSVEDVLEGKEPLQRKSL